MLRSLLAVAIAVLLAGCTDMGSGQVALGPDGKPLPRLYRLSSTNAGQVQFRLLDGVNSLRQVKGLAPVQFNAALNAAAATHSRDMALQNRPWHFGSDGSSPIDRVQRTGYTGQLIGENISETYESELETLAAWMQEEPSRVVLMDERAREIGFSWHQEDNGKIWWTYVAGAPASAASPAPES